MSIKIIDTNHPLGGNCVLYARQYCPELPHGLWFLWQKKRLMNIPVALPNAVAVMSCGLPWGHVGIVKSSQGDRVTIIEANYKKGIITQRVGTEAELKILGYYYPDEKMTIDQLKKELGKDFVKKDTRFYFEPRDGSLWIIGKGKKYHCGDSRDDWKIFDSGMCGSSMTDKERNLPQAKSRSEVL